MATSTLSAEKLSWKETLGSAVKAASANDNALAFNLFEKAFRACTTDVSRRDIIRKSLALRFCDAPKLSDVEQAAADVCIMNAKVAFLKKALAPYSIPAKLVILEKIKEISPGQAVWVENKIRSYSHTLMEALTQEEKTRLEEILSTTAAGKLDNLAYSYIKEGNYRMAIKLYWAYLCRKEKVKDPERERIERKINEITKKLTTELTPDEDNRLKRLFKSDSITKWRVLPTMKYYFVELKPKIDAMKRKDLLLIDLAYVLLSDFTSKDPSSKARTRLTLYSDPTSEEGLEIRKYYFGISSQFLRSGRVLPALVSGVNEMASMYCEYMLGDNRAVYKEAKEKVALFEKYYVPRDIIPLEMYPYDCAAGFLFHFICKYCSAGFSKISWLKVRNAFDIMRAQKWANNPRWRSPQLMAYAFAKVSKRELYKDFARFRFGFGPENYNDFAMEAFQFYPEYEEALKLYKDRKYWEAEQKLWTLIRDYPPFPLSDKCYRLLMYSYNAQLKKDAAKRLQQRLGIITAWKTIGPFYSNVEALGGQPLAEMFPPETGINYGKTYPNQKQVAKWKTTNTNLEGRFSLSFSYPARCSAYALVYVKCPAETDAFLYYSSDCTYKVIINGNIVTVLSARGGFGFDNDRIPITLRKGTNRVLVKMYNPSGAILGGGRIVSREGLPIPGLTQTVNCLENDIVPVVLPKTGEVLYSEQGMKESHWYRRWRTAAGSFVARDGVVYASSSETAGKWNMFLKQYRTSLRGPANIAWLKKGAKGNLRDVCVSFKLTYASAVQPDFLLLLDGEGEDDPQSGVQIGIAKFLYSYKSYFVIIRYNRIMSLRPLSVLKPANSYLFSVLRKDERLWLKINGKVIFNGIGIPPTNGNYPFGLCSFKNGAGIKGFAVKGVEAGDGIKK